MEILNVTGILTKKTEINHQTENKDTKSVEVLIGWNYVITWKVVSREGKEHTFFRKVAAFGDYFFEQGKGFNLGDVLQITGLTKLGKYKSKQTKKVVPTLEVTALSVTKIADTNLIEQVLNEEDEEDDEEDEE